MSYDMAGSLVEARVREEYLKKVRDLAIREHDILAEANRREFELAMEVAEDQRADRTGKRYKDDDASEMIIDLATESGLGDGVYEMLNFDTMQEAIKFYKKRANLLLVKQLSLEGQQLSLI